MLSPLFAKNKIAPGKRPAMQTAQTGQLIDKYGRWLLMSKNPHEPLIVLINIIDRRTPYLDSPGRSKHIRGLLRFDMYSGKFDKILITRTIQNICPHRWICCSQLL